MKSFGSDLNSIVGRLRGGLVVSCQALEDEPLHSSFIMSKMALAAKVGGASGIRANSVEDIIAIKNEVDLPVIGIIKRVYDGSDVYITPTMSEVDDLVECGCDIIAIDATFRTRPDGSSIDTFFKSVRDKYPSQIFMADCSTYEEAVNADRIGFDLIGTTMIGYTESSKNLRVDENDFEIVKRIVADVKSPVVAEGNIDNPQKAKRVIEIGCAFVVVGSIITRPQLITKRFVDGMR